MLNLVFPASETPVTMKDSFICDLKLEIVFALLVSAAILFRGPINLFVKRFYLIGIHIFFLMLHLHVWTNLHMKCFLYFLSGLCADFHKMTSALLTENLQRQLMEKRVNISSISSDRDVCLSRWLLQNFVISFMNYYCLFHKFSFDEGYKCSWRWAIEVWGQNRLFTVNCAHQGTHCGALCVMNVFFHTNVVVSMLCF